MALTPAYFETDNVTGQEQKLTGAGGPLTSNAAWLANHAAEHAAMGLPENTAILVGDSNIANNNASGVNYGYHTNIGAFNWANAYMGQKLKVVANLGVGGAQITGTNGIAENISSYLSLYQSKYVVLLAGTNDVANGVSYADIIAGFSSVISAVRRSGRKLLLSTIFPRAAASLSGSQGKVLCAVNSWLREVGITYSDVLVSDPFRALADPTNANSDPLAIDMYDGVLHLAPAGAMKVGKQWAADWGPSIPVSPRQFNGVLDVFDATYNPYGNMLSNGLLQTLGATSGTGYAGNNPTGYTVQRIAGAGTWTGSAVARTDLNGNQGNWYRAAIASETNASAQYELRQNALGPNSGSGTTYQIGDQLFAEVELKVAHTGATNYVKAVHLIATEYDRSGSAVWVSRGLSQYTASPTGGGSALQWANDYTVKVRTPVFTSIGSTGSGSDASQRITVAVDVLMDGSVSNALTVDFGHMSLRRVVP